MDPKPTIIVLPGGDAILATEIKTVAFSAAYVSEAFGKYASRVLVNGKAYHCCNDGEAKAARERIILEWRAALG